MPTASTAQILGNTECFEPLKDNLYVRRVLSGNFTVANPHLQEHLKEIGLWSPQLIEQLRAHRGSIQGIPGIPPEVKEVYLTAYEMKQRHLLEMAAERGPFIDQSQSLNLFIASPDTNILTSIHMLAWKLGLKTGLYYCRRKQLVDPAAQTIKGKMMGTGGSGSVSTSVSVSTSASSGTPSPVIADPTCESCSS